MMMKFLPGEQSTRYHLKIVVVFFFVLFFESQKICVPLFDCVGMGEQLSVARRPRFCRLL